MASPTLDPLIQYYDALDAFDVDTAAALFTENAAYVRPPTDDVEETTVGRDAIRLLFERRGSKPTRHVVEKTLVGDDAGAVVGRLQPDDPDDPA